MCIFLETIECNNKEIRRFEYTDNKLTKVIENDKIINIEYDRFGNIIKLGNSNIKYNKRLLMESYDDITYEYNYQGIRTKKTKANEYEIKYYLDYDKIIEEEKKDLKTKEITRLIYYYEARGIRGISYKKNEEERYYSLIKDPLNNISKVINKGKIVGEYKYNAWEEIEVEIKEISDEVDRYVINNNPFRYKGYYYDKEISLYYCINRYYSPELGRFLQVSDVSELNPHSINGLNLYAYANNNPISFSYNNSSTFGSTSVGGGLVSPIGTDSSFSGNINSGPTSKGGLNLGWLANGLDTGSTIHGLYTSISGLVNHTAYFAKNLTPFMDNMTMIGASMKDGVLAFNQFSWGLGKSDVFGVVLGVGLDIYDSVQRGVSPGGVVLGATLTAAKGVGLIYLNKGIMYGATALGSAICPGVGTVVGFVVGGVVCILVDIFASNWLDDLIDKIAK